jgi:hypothetical protein
VKKVMALFLAVFLLSELPASAGLGGDKPLPQQPAGMPLAHPVLFADMLHRTTPPLGA